MDLPSWALVPSKIGTCANSFDKMNGRTSVVAVTLLYTGEKLRTSVSMNLLISKAFTLRIHWVGDFAVVQLKCSTTVSQLAVELPLRNSASDSMIAAWNGRGAGGKARSCLTDHPPADSPKIVILQGSPPKAPIFWETHDNALRWSSKPAFWSLDKVSGELENPKTDESSY